MQTDIIKSMNCIIFAENHVFRQRVLYKKDLFNNFEENKRFIFNVKRFFDCKKNYLK